MAKPVPIKVRLTNQGEDSETPWAEDLGPAPGPPGSRLVRLINVPFMHAKPTWGDTIIVSPVEAGFPTWDRGGVPFEEIESRIARDGGRWAMIVAYAPHPEAKDPFGALAYACAEHDVVCEGAWAPRDGEPGRAYLAVPSELGDAELMQRLRTAQLPCELVQLHPAPLPVALPAPSIVPRGKVGAKPVPAAVPRPSAKPAAAARPTSIAKPAPAMAPKPREAKPAPAAAPKRSAKPAPAAAPKRSAKPAPAAAPKRSAKAAPAREATTRKAKPARAKTTARVRRT